MKLNLFLKKIDNDNFKKYGDLVSIENIKSIQINDGHADRYNDLANIDVAKNNGNPNLSIFESKPRIFPIRIEMLERHPLGSQLFFPLNNSNFIVVVAPSGKTPITEEIESFIIPSNMGINYNLGVWHYPLISLIKSKFLVIDRKGPENNLEIFKFKDDIITLNYE